MDSFAILEGARSPSSDERILYVDDEREAREAFASAAHELGFRVDTANGGGEALTMACQHHYAVIAADLRMPTINGLSLLQLLRPKWPQASYLLVTGATQFDLPVRSDGEPLVDEVVQKPWSVEQLSRVLSRALDRYRDRRSENLAAPSPDLPLVVVDGDPESARRLEALVEDALPTTEAVYVVDIDAALDRLLRDTFRAGLVNLDTARGGGIDSLRRLRKAAPALALIALGGADDSSLALRAVKAGAQDYLVKSKVDGYVLRRSVDYAIERKLTQTQLHFLSQHDPVTGLANRSLFRERLNHAIVQARRRETMLATLLLDIDRFKTVNDSLGYDLGDRLLKTVAQRLRENLREGDTVARLGGDEFAVLLEDLDDGGEGVATAQRLLEALIPPVRLNEYEIVPSAGVGIAFFPDHGESAAELLQRADKAMYRAKQKGRDGFEIYSGEGEESRSGVLQRLHFESGIRHALEHEQYLTFFQPQVTMDRAGLIAVEALLRWNHPKAGVVPPSRFMPFLESSGLIHGVGAWILENACRQVKAWQSRGFPRLRVSVNLSARQFEGSDLVSTVERILAETALPPTSLELEITESLLMRDIERTQGILEALKALGVRIAIDDFGTGYSSLSYLTKFPLDCLKIDRSFVRDITMDADDRAVAEAIIGLGHALRLDVVAEGVETEQQLALLNGCDGFQGFLVSRPQPAENTFEFLKQYGESDSSSVKTRNCDETPSGSRWENGSSSPPLQARADRALDPPSRDR